MNYAEIIDGFERALELERELGVRSVECDRELVKVAAAASYAAGRDRSPAPVAAASYAAGRDRSPAPVVAASYAAGRDRSPAPVAVAGAVAAGQTPAAEPRVAPPKRPKLPLVFLHHAALSAGGVEMMAKIITALKFTAEQAPIVFTGELPAAEKYVVLGGKALAQWFPNQHSAPGNSFEHEGREVYVTYSPEYILKFKIVTPAVKQLKLEMWNGIKRVRENIV